MWADGFSSLEELRENFTMQDKSFERLSESGKNSAGDRLSLNSIDDIF